MTGRTAPDPAAGAGARTGPAAGPSSAARAQPVPHPVVLRVAPVAGETTWSYLSRLAAHYGMEPGALLPWWTWAGSRPRDEAGPRDDAEVLLNPAGRQLLAHLGGVGERALARALPAFADEPQPAPAASPSKPGEPAGTGGPAGRWKIASAGEHGPAAYGCGLCTAARTGRDTVVVRYAAPWQRVCARHQRWMLTCGDGHRHRNLDLRAAPDIAAAQRAWPRTARTAATSGADPGRVFALAHAVVCAWWEQALGWERERIWPARLHAVGVGMPGRGFGGGGSSPATRSSSPRRSRWRPRCSTPACRSGSGRTTGPVGRYAPSGRTGRFFRELAVRLGRPWLGEVGGAPQTGLVLGGPLLDCMGAFTRIRRGQRDPRGYGLDPWWLRADHRPASARVQLRELTEQAAAARHASENSGGAGTGPAGTATVRRLFRDRYGRAAAAYTAARTPPG